MANACPTFEAGLGPKPCERVDLDGGVEQGVAILKDLVGVAQMLAIPTRRITGIEDPQMLAPNAPPVFAVAWAAKTLVEERLHRALPREAVGLAINSKWARSQEQLHVHVDCVAIPVMKALAEYASAFDSQWRAMTVPLQGRVYFARRVNSANLADVAPLKLLADGLEGARAHMGAYSLAAVGATFDGKPGFVLLADSSLWKAAATPRIFRITIARSLARRPDRTGPFGAEGALTGVGICGLRKLI